MKYLTLLVALVATTSLADDEFSFTVMDVFKISGGDVDVVITGRVESGTIEVGDTVCLHSEKNGDRELTVGAIELFRKLAISANAGDMIGIGVSGVDKDDLSKGDTVSASCR